MLKNINEFFRKKGYFPAFIYHAYRSTFVEQKLINSVQYIIARCFTLISTHYIQILIVHFNVHIR